MRIAWIAATFSADAKSALFGLEKEFGSGNWLDDEVRHLLCNDKIEEVIQVSSYDKIARDVKKGEITYVDLGLGRKVSASKSFLQLYGDALHDVLTRFQPDVVQVWGTETPIAQIALSCSKQMGIPTILCPQGILASLLHFPNGHVSAFDMCSYNFLDWVKIPIFNSTKRAYRKNNTHEREAVKLADYILSDNQWTFDYCRCLNTVYKPLKYPLPVNDCFNETIWAVEESTPHSIISVSPRSAYKGQHVLLRAVARLKKEFKDVKVIFPAMCGKMDGGLNNGLRRTPYIDMLRRIIKRYQLQDNVVFLDRLSPDELASVMRTCRVFVNPSVIESNCMSLREAMCLGMPVVSAFAGSIQEYVSNGDNGYLYRYEEDEILFRILYRLFESNEDCVRIGHNARSSMEEFYLGGVSLSEIYSTVLQAGRVG